MTILILKCYVLLCCARSWKQKVLSAAASSSGPIDQHAGNIAYRHDRTDFRGVLNAAGYVHNRVNRDSQRDDARNQSGQSSHLYPDGQRCAQCAVTQKRQRRSATYAMA